MQKNPNAEILVLDEKGTNLGHMLYHDAKLLSTSRNLDLVQVSKDQDKIVVFKIMDHGKYKYEKKKNKQKSTAQPLKEMGFRLRIDTHDMEIKINRIKGFLSKGSDVKITVTMRGRERATPQLAHQKLEAILVELSDLVQVQQKRSTKSSVFVTVRPLPTAKKNIERSKELLEKVVKKDDDKDSAYVRWQTVRRDEQSDTYKGKSKDAKQVQQQSGGIRSSVLGPRKEGDANRSHSDEESVEEKVSQKTSA